RAVSTILPYTTLFRSTGGGVTISIGQPVHIGDGWDWACPYLIEGLQTPIQHRVFGIDALQTLQLVSVSIRDKLEQCGERPNWLRSEEHTSELQSRENL